MTEVCIIGIGLHPFGRTDGVSGRSQGAYAVRQALKDPYPRARCAGLSSLAVLAESVPAEVCELGVMQCCCCCCCCCCCFMCTSVVLVGSSGDTMLAACNEQIIYGPIPDTSRCYDGSRCPAGP